MHRILKLIILGLTFFLPTVSWAGGSRQVITETADGIDIWQKDFDVSGMKPGTYNVIINAKDAAGNVGVSGPFNIRVDPKAGLPESYVVYPEQNQVLRGDVNIVGVASSRYGIKQVLVKIDNGEYKIPEGREYWDFHIPAADLNEGDHSIYVKAIDANDLEGPEVKINFTLDTTPPVFELTNREIGDFISGNVRVTGRVSDANGIETLELSSDGGLNYSRLRHSAGGDGARTFKFTIPSKNYEDGPLVYFLRAVNKTGYSETKPFLFFVNNYPPQIEILSPTQEENTFGRTQVTGRVISGVGLSQFYYEWAGERADIPLRPGDPFWTVVFPISMANNRAVPFRVTAVDKSGNTTTVTQRFQDTRRARDPVVVIDYPARPSGLGRMQLGPEDSIYGHIAPGFFPYGIILEGEIEYIMAQPSFRIPPEMIPVGTSTLRMWAIDEEDVTGQAFTIRINKQAPPNGWVQPDSYITVETPMEYEWFEDSVTVTGSIDGYSGQNLEYRLRWDDTWKEIRTDSMGAFRITISLAGMEEGPVPIELRTVTNGKGDIPMYLPVNKFVTRPVINFLTPHQNFGPVQRATTAAGMVDYFVPLTEISYSLDGVNFEPMDFAAKYGRAWFNGYFDFTSMNNAGQQLIIRAVDRAGNTVTASPDMVFDNSDSFPKIILNAPLEGQLVTGNFEINGLAYVDVGITAVYYRIITPNNPWDSVTTTLGHRGDVEFNKIETTQNYQIPLTVYDVRDGENILEIFAEDTYGVTGEITQRVFKVSTAGPETAVGTPRMEFWNKGSILVQGSAIDRNGIENIVVSMDNGISYQKADFVSSQAEPSKWGISVSTETYADGVYSMLVRTEDKYGISMFSNGIINIDNSPPAIDLGSPQNGDAIGVILPITGQIYDNIALESISIQLVNNNDPRVQMSYALPNSFVIMESMDVSSFPDGDYSLKISAFDQSGNETSVIRNITIIKARAASEVAIINPLPGINHSGPLVVSGKITGAVIPEQVTLLLNNRPYTNIDVNRYGVFRYDLPEEAIGMTDRPVMFSAAFTTPSGEVIESYKNPVKVTPYGPVLVVDSHRDGDVITKRPYISGRTWYVRPVEKGEVIDDLRAEKYLYSIRKVEISFDNGQTFRPVDGADHWKYRLETSLLEPGSLPLIIKATFNNNSVAIRRILLTVDVQPPTVNTIGPVENTAFRSILDVYGSVVDNYDMDSVEVTLRPGDKAGYSVPAFIQGLYLDASFLGGLSWSTGLGLTFFDDNVKVQVNASQAPSGRYSGYAFGGKVLANIFNKNLGEWFGPDWEFWKTSLVLGAHFSYFLMEDGETPVWMGEFLGQWEIIKADMGFFFPKWKYFKSFSLYTEPGIWFAPSDVDTQKAWRTKFTIGFGGRISLF